MKMEYNGVREAVQVEVFRYWFKVHGWCPALGIGVVGRSKRKVWTDLTNKIREWYEERESSGKDLA